MSITERLLAFTLLGSEWVLWLLIALSVLSIAVMVERFLSLPGGGRDLEELSRSVQEALGTGDVAGARRVLGAPATPEARVGLVGLNEMARGREAAAEAMASAKSRERLAMERRLGILGTLGNNAPFIGLFGTVLGIIKAFADLSRNAGGGANVVMSG
ncbi:MAG TPA: MotA/TolQ/ExbB proton channel family protein, partial [Polyangia bacterium]